MIGITQRSGCQREPIRWRGIIIRFIQIVTILLLGILGFEPANAEIFADDFNRPDGPLGPPWELLDQSPLYIENQGVVARENEYGLMLYGEQCPNCYCGEAILLATFNGALRLHSGLGFWEAGELPSGIYMARIVDAIGSQPVKLIKLR